jgi:hypothetical protein
MRPAPFPCFSHRESSPETRGELKDGEATRTDRPARSALGSTVRRAASTAGSASSISATGYATAAMLLHSAALPARICRTGIDLNPDFAPLIAHHPAGAGMRRRHDRSERAKQRNLKPEQILRAIGHRRDTPSTGAWPPGAHAVERAAVPGDIGRGSPGGIIDGAMIRGPARPDCALM